MLTDTYAEQRPGTAVVVVGYFTHCLIIIHGHPAIKTKQANSQQQAMQLPMGDTRQLFLKNFLYGRTKAVACLHMSLLFGQCWILQSEKYRLWINVIGSVQEEICP